MTFKDCIVYGSARSPFARRVRLALAERSIQFEWRLEDVFKPRPEFLQISPLGRIPLVELTSGERLVESSMIIELLRQSLGEQATLESSAWSGLAVGISDKVVEYYLERLRPEVVQDQEWLAEIEGALTRTVGEFEAARRRGAFSIPSVDRGLRQHEIDWVVALSYVAFRYRPGFLKDYPLAEEWRSEVEKRPRCKESFPVVT